ncbi:MAG: hypothetical protein AAFU53_13135 [Cyanobacteria bacterium J06632_3]
MDSTTTAALPDAVARAIAHLQSQGSTPNCTELVTALLALEKAAKRQKQRFDYAQLVGTWQLGFITGTVKTRKQAGTVLGSGRFIPRLVTVQLRYEPEASTGLRGTVYNTVGLANLTMTLSGPTQYWPKTNSLAFDFTHLCVAIGRQSLFQCPVRGGQAQTEKFFTEGLKTQAFFTYFLVTPNCLAARGRGGGLALWTRQNN